ncbi:MAG: DoxX family protein [Bacteroidales bacterium]|nr:DoxX family protein [Bacteroidales bacterium]
MKILRSLSRIIVGLVFIFSGVVKAIDPLGSAYKFHDYFEAFNLGVLNNLSLPLGVLLCTIEFIAGFSVLTGFRQKNGILASLLLMLIFTPLTLVLALTNPVSDCGCFGDAVHLSNWQTFWKNIILLGAVIILFANRKNVKQNFKTSTEWMAVGAAAALLILFAIFNLKYLPVIDFLPYKTEVKIADKMVIPEGAPADVYETSFIYEKDGIKKEFTLSNYPANDTSWKFVDQKSVLLRKGYKPPIHDFSITGPEGDDLTQKVLEKEGYTVLMISKKLREAGRGKLSEGFELGRFCMSNGIDFLILTASGSDEGRSYDSTLTFCSVDETTLKTMIRANPGYILLKDGTIIGKWSAANCPDKEWFGNLSR